MMTISASPSTFRPRASALAGAIAAVLACGSVPAAAQDHVLSQLSALTAARQVAVLDSIVNGQGKGQVFALVEHGAVIAIDATALREWRVNVPNTTPLQFEDRSFIAIADLPGAHANLDQKFQRLILTIPPT